MATHHYHAGLHVFSTGSLLIASLAVLLFFYAGCGRPPEEQFNTGMEKLRNPDTMDEGIELLAELVASHPEYEQTPEALLNLALAYQGKQQYDKTVECYTRIIDEYDSTPQAYKAMFMLGFLYSDELNQPDEAKVVLERFIATYPDSELVASAEVLLSNVGKPIEEWDTFKNLNEDGESPEDSE